MKLAVLFSGGKDSCYALYKASKDNEISCLISIKSKNADSYMFHTPNIELTKLQAEALEIPLLEFETEGKKEEELKDLENAIRKAKERYKIEGVVTGAVASKYQAERIERICKNLGLKCINPLWQRKQDELIIEIIESGFRFIITKIAAEGLNKSWLGRIIEKEDAEKLIKISKRVGLNPIFEGGEAESLVIDCPLFKKKIIIENAEITMESGNIGVYIIKKVKLVEK